jgi:hypothetical protein
MMTARSGMAVLAIAGAGDFAACAGEIYYVDKDSVGGAAADTNPGTITQPWATISKADATVQAGDTVCLRRGTYQETIAPDASGTEQARITYRNYDGETVTISRADLRFGIDLVDKAYVTIDGIDCDGTQEYLRLRNSHHVWVQNCTFDNSSWQTSWPTGVRMTQNSHHNWIHHCLISRCGYANEEDNGGIMNIGYWGNESDRSDYNLVENNTLAYGGHHVLSINSRYNVIRNNAFHNEEWMVGLGGELFGNRHLIIEGPPEHAMFNLVEGNVFAYCGKPPDGNGVSGVSVRTTHNIVRRNIFYDNDEAGLNLCTDSWSVPPDYIRFNHVYHNVFFHNGYAAKTTFQPFLAGMSLTVWTADGPPITDASIKNNIFWQNAFDQAMTFNHVNREDQVISHNWEEAGDPLFVDDETPADPLDPDVVDFHLQPSSPCIDAGDFLTRTTGSGSGNVIPVVDAGYFTDGWGIVEGDLVQLEGQTGTVRITSVDYAGNLLTVDQALSWTAGQGVTSPYQGACPDMGVYELGMDADTDGDGLSDVVEAGLLTNPSNPDSDGDGMTDGWEVENALDPLVDDAAADPDGDGFTNYQEFVAGSDPRDGESLPSAPETTDLGCAAEHAAGSGAGMGCLSVLLLATLLKCRRERAI